MPLAKIELDSILGLTTNRNETSGINSPNWSSMSAWAVENTSAGATAPNTLLDCTNITISRNKQAAARTAFVEVWDFTFTYGSDNAFNTNGMYAIPNSFTNSIIYAWVNATTANIGNFTNTIDVKMSSCVYYIGSSTPATTFASYPQLLPDFSWDSTADGFSIKSFNLARFASSYSNIYVFSSNGVFRTTTGYIQSPTSTVYNEFKRVTLPVVKSISASVTAAPTDASRWFSSGKRVDIQILVTDQLSATQVYQGKPSRVYTVTNHGTVSSIKVTFSVDNTNISLASGGVGIYRTVMYNPGESAPIDLYKCYEASLSAANAVTSGSTTTYTDIELILNDTSITQFQLLYTSPNAEAGSLQTGLLQSAESSAPPTARDVELYGNFTVYGNVCCPPFAPLTMTNLPNTDGLDQLRIGATTVALTYTPNSTTPPANTGVIDATTGTYQGINSSPNSGKGYNLVIRPVDPTITTSSAVAASYSVPYYAVADSLSLGGGSGATRDIRVTPKANTSFDIAQFPATGFVAIVLDSSHGYVIALFSYQSYAQTSGSGYYTFSNCLAYGVPFTDNTWTGNTSGVNIYGLNTSGSYIMYSIPGTNVNAFDVYAIGSDAATPPGKYNDQIGFSLLPTYELYPTRLYNQSYVGKVTNLSQNGASTGVLAGAYSPVLASINFRGIYALQSGELLNQAAENACDLYNSTRAPEDPYAVLDQSSTAPVGRIRFESLYSGYNRFSTYTNNAAYTYGLKYYDSVFGQVFRADGSLPTIKFAEPIPPYSGGAGTSQNIMQQSVQTIAGVTVSKYNKPEEIPIGQNLTPTIIGDPLKPIIKLVNQYNQLLIFKQNEGTYRTNIKGSGGENILPSFDAITLLDNTAWLLLPESVQVFEGAVVYFSNKSFVTITQAGQVLEISSPIATELLTNFATILANGDTDKVRSWVITQQRLYCCYFPHVNDDKTSQTYVFSFDTGQWTKWSGEVNDAVVSATGILSITENIFRFSNAITDTESLQVAVLNPLSKYWTTLRQANFQTPSETQIEDVISLSSFSVNPGFDPSSSTYDIIITNFNTSSVYGNLFYLLMLYKNRTMWYLSETNGFLSTILVDASTTTIRLRVVDNIYSQNPIVPAGLTVGVNDSLITTVNTALYFNKFFIANPRGSTMSHFNEVQLYMQEGEDYTNLAIGFSSTEAASEYIYTSSNPVPQTVPPTPPNAFIVTSTGNYVVLNSSTYNNFKPYYVLAPSQYVFRVLVPRNAGRGRYIQLAVLHDTPNDIFILNSITYIYRDLNSTKIKFHS